MTSYAKRSLMEVAPPMSGWLVGFCENTWLRMSSFRRTDGGVKAMTSPPKGHGLLTFVLTAAKNRLGNLRGS